jgi:hypothetical protein
MDTTGTRHPATTQLLRWFEYGHLPTPLASVSARFYGFAYDLLELPDGPELTTCLRKLLEAKDCAVRAALDVQQQAEGRRD